MFPPPPPAAAHPGHLFVVEHDALLQAMLCDYLGQQGWTVSAVASADDLPGRMGRLRPDLVVMGAGPRGVHACQRLRAQGDDVPIILLTEGDDSGARVAGLQAGADDCFSKPIAARELAARTRALLRRLAPGSQGDAPGAAAPGGACRIGAFTFVPATRSVHGEGRVRVLNDAEFGVLRQLVDKAGEPVPREQLARQQPGTRLRSVDTAVMRLRRLLEPDPAEPRYLQTVRGRGYVFVPAVPLLG